MNWKKIISLVLIVSLLAGCASSNTNPESTISTTNESSEVEQPISQSIEKETELLKEPEKENSTQNSKVEKEPISKEIAKPDETPPKNRPLKQVDDITEEDVTAALSVSLEELSALDNTPVTWGPGHNTEPETVPAAPIQLQTDYGNSNNGYFYIPNSKKIFLTFDEGYELGYTPQILDTLKEKNVTGVFFVTLGYVESRPDLIQRMIDEGHIVGNHSSSHPVGGMPTLSTLDMAKDMLYLHRYVKENFGYEMTLFRPPEGTFSQQSLAVAQALGYKSFFWSFAYNDWNPDNQLPPAEAKSAILDRSHPGAIYLLHAVSSTNTTILGEVIDGFIEKGYTIATTEDYK